MNFEALQRPSTMPRISQNPNYSPHKRGRIWRLRSIGYSTARVAELERIPKSSVSGIALRYERQYRGRDLPRSGQPRKVSERDKRIIFRIINEDPFIQNKRLLERSALRCSVSTLISYLRSWGILHKRAIRRPKLTEDLAARRLRFAEEHYTKPISWWTNFVFSDEVSVARGDGSKTKWCFARKYERFLEDKVQPRAPTGRKLLMFWGAIGAYRRSSLNVVNGDPDAPRGGVSSRSILGILRSELPTILEPGNLFMQDNASVHTANLVQSWLRGFAEENGVDLIRFPAYSPDLNPIENVWGLLKENIIKSHPELEDMPVNEHLFELLERAAVECWEEFNQETLYKLVATMPHRIEAIVHSRGWYTKY